MNERKESGIRATLPRLGRVAGIFLRSRAGTKAKLLLSILILLILGINGLNVLNSYIGRDFMSAIADRDLGGFQRNAWLYLGVFAVSTSVAVLLRFAEGRLALLWREWQTQRVAKAYLDRHIYLHFKETGSITNPDQRIAEDIRTLTTTTLYFLLMFLNGTFTAISFSGVLWTISPTLFVIAVAYAAAGSGLTLWLGRPLISLNYQQADREADFRADLIYVHQNAEGLAFTRDEARMREHLARRIDQLVRNFRRIISVNRNLNFFTTGYNYLIQLIPALLVAPLFIAGNVEFGVIGQATMAFATLVGAFSLIVTQFQSISSYAAVVARLGEFFEASESAAQRYTASCLDYEPSADHITYAGLHLWAPLADDNLLLRDLNVTFAPGKSVLITGPNQLAMVALFHATAGFHESGKGSIIRPSSDKLAFLLEQPYLPPSSLRELLTPPSSKAPSTDAAMLSVLCELGLDLSFTRNRDFDTTHHWARELSLGNKQILAVARALLAKPQFAFLDHLDSSLNDDEFRNVRQVMARHGVACIMLGNAKTSPEGYDDKLELYADGTWKWTQVG